MTNTKYVILLGDGMADRPLKELDGKTPLMVAKTPYMDEIASRGLFGYVNNAAEGFPPGSDVMNMNIMGYDPALYYTGRAPIEAAGMGLKLNPTDVAFRCNLVTLRHKDGKIFMEDYSAGHISLYEGDAIVKYIQDNLGKGDITFYPGKSYRHIMVWHNGPTGLNLTPPHDILGREIREYIPQNDFLLELMEKSWALLQDHPANQLRHARSELPANSLWFWGEGKWPTMPTYRERWGIEGGVMVTAVDLLKGLGALAGLETPDIPGATGYLDTNYENKVEAALDRLSELNFAYIHVEAPDECGHNADVKGKIRAIEDFDRNVVGAVLRQIKKCDSWRILVMPDHATPIEVRTHVNDPIPFALLTSDDPGSPTRNVAFAESPNPNEHPNYLDSCKKLNEIFFKKE